MGWVGYQSGLSPIKGVSTKKYKRNSDGVLVFDIASLSRYFYKKNYFPLSKHIKNSLLVDATLELV